MQQTVPILKREHPTIPLSSAISIDDLRLFYLVAEAGGISAASRRFGIAKATFSRALGRLEQDAKAPLFDRMATGLRLTGVGEALHDAAASATQAGSDAEEVLRAAHGKPQGRLRIAASALSAQQLLGPVLARLRADHPEVRPSVHVTGHGPDPLAEDLDIVLRLGRPEEPYLIARRIVAAPLLLYASSKTRADLTDVGVVETLGRIVIDVPGSPANWVLQGAGDGIIRFEDEPFAVVGDPTVALGILRAGCGVAFLPSLFGDPHVASGDFVRVLPHFEGPTVEVYAAFPPRRASIPAVRVFIDMLVEMSTAMTASTAF